MKKSKLIILFGIAILFFTACEANNNVVSNGKKVNTDKMEHIHCTREGTAKDVEVSLEYDLYTSGEDLNLLQSVEKVTSENAETLKTYEDAYKGIHEHYKGLEYYDTKVERNENSVVSTITINYEKIDINKLLDIEGEEDNIIENGKAKVEKWKTLAEKFGTKCVTVEEE